MKYDVLITVAEKDFNKLRFVYDSIWCDLEGVGGVYIISNIEIPNNVKIACVNYFLDQQVLDLDFSRFTGKIKTREGWYRQQFIKLLQEVTGDNYLVMDADIILNRKLIVVENEKPFFLLGKDQHNKPYFDLMKKVFDLDRVYPYSFINEIMFFKRSIIKHLLHSTSLNIYGFFELVLNELNRNNQISGFSEYELYGNYVAKYFPDTYNYKYTKTAEKGKKGLWEDAEIEKMVRTLCVSDVDIIKIHSWL